MPLGIDCFSPGLLQRLLLLCARVRLGLVHDCFEVAGIPHRLWNAGTPSRGNGPAWQHGVRAVSGCAEHGTWSRIASFIRPQNLQVFCRLRGSCWLSQWGGKPQGGGLQVRVEVPRFKTQVRTLLFKPLSLELVVKPDKGEWSDDGLLTH